MDKIKVTKSISGLKATTAADVVCIANAEFRGIESAAYVALIERAVELWKKEHQCLSTAESQGEGK